MRAARLGRALTATALVAGITTTALPTMAAPTTCVAVNAYRAGGSETAAAAGQICTGETGEVSGEPTVGVTARGTVLLYPAYVQHPGTSYTRPAVAISHDRGRTFALVTPTVADAVPTHPVDLDPYMYVDPLTSRIFVESNTTGNCDVLSFSDDDGATWAVTTLAGCVTFDHENVFAGPPPRGGPAPTGYPNVVYRCAYSTGAFGTLHTSDACQKSLDGGVTWVLTGMPAFVYDPQRFAADPDVSTTPYGCMDQLGHGVVGPDGTVYLPAGICGVPEIAISHDEGATWEHSVVSTTVRQHEFSNGVTVNDTAVAVDRHGRLYALWISRDTLPYLARSADGGKTWSAPVRVSPPDVTSTALPEIAAGADGRLAISFMGSTNAPRYPSYVRCQDDLPGCAARQQEAVAQQVSGDRADDNVTWHGYLVVTDDPRSPTPLFVGGPVSKGPFVRGMCGIDNCQVEKDFIDVRIGRDGAVYGSYVDGCSATCATAPGGRGDMNTGVVARFGSTR
jgi:hypothetical protein